MNIALSGAILLTRECNSITGVHLAQFLCLWLLSELFLKAWNRNSYNCNQAACSIRGSTKRRLHLRAHAHQNSLGAAPFINLLFSDIASAINFKQRIAT